MIRTQTGRLIGGIFGFLFIMANAGALPEAVAIALRVLAVTAFLALVLTLRRARGEQPAADGARTDFGRNYRYVVAAEVVVGAAGLVVINPVLHAPQATVGWIALVVGLHFFGLAAVWRLTSMRWLAAGLSVCGAVGLVLGAYGFSTAVIALIAGIAPGVMLLGSVLAKRRA
ncbi:MULTISPECIES: hypothetical protein [unclassified Streptomyces]|uniref:hypothetical protein n=1 Tax=unclassified Streptomyces TaxID=2593676 RepID=UPI002E300D38|nr:MULTISPECIES: hypothetical protein [unclassified Streptomyces]WUC65211.1 hypothetical protein OG861_13685 [Streptomyces sp. NBC_00539]